MFLGIDIGTSCIKAVIVDEWGKVRSQASAPLSITRPQPLWSEQDAEDWWDATNSAVGQLDAACRRRVLAIGLAGQMHGATLLDASDAPIRPAILWNDGRSAAECAEIEARVPDARGITGNIAMPGFTAPKLLWVRRHEPEAYARIKSVLLPKDFIRLRMSGEKLSDMSDASGTYWLDVGHRRWSDVLLEACGLTQDHMPGLVEGSDHAGNLRPEIARNWHMECVPIAGGAGDNAAGAIGVGATAAGDAILSLGTSGVTFVVTDAFRPHLAGAVHAFCHCLPERWHQMAVHLSAASCIDWAQRLLGAGNAGEVVELAERTSPGPEIFLPYLSGERTPHNDPEVRGALLAIDHDTTPGRVAHAVLEGVAMAFADGVDAIRMSGTRVDRLSVIGGGARSRFWGRMLASAIGTDLQYLDGGEVGPALGAAHLARLALTGDAPSTVCIPPRVSAIVHPDPALRDRMAPRRRRFQEAYQRTTPKVPS